MREEASNASVDYLEVIGHLADEDPPSHVFGGFADDALLDGRSTRSHGDLDVLVARDDLDAQFDRFHAMGFASFDPLFEPVPGQPLVYGASANGLAIELGVYDRDPDGSIWFVLPWNEGMYRVSLPDGTLAYPPGTIDGVAIRTISPLAQYMMRETFLLTGTFGPPRPTDASMQTRLRERFLSHVADDELRPTLTAYQG